MHESSSSRQTISGNATRVKLDTFAHSYVFDSSIQTLHNHFTGTAMAPKGKKSGAEKQRTTEEEVEEPLQAVVCCICDCMLCVTVAD